MKCECREEGGVRMEEEEEEEEEKEEEEEEKEEEEEEEEDDALDIFSIPPHRKVANAEPAMWDLPKYLDKVLQKCSRGRAGHTRRR